MIFSAWSLLEILNFDFVLVFTIAFLVTANGILVRSVFTLGAVPVLVAVYDG